MAFYGRRNTLDGAKLVCLDDKGEHCSVHMAKGRMFKIGYYTTCDYILEDSRAEGIHCEIQVDNFGRVSINNLSEQHPIRVNGQLVSVKRPLLNDSVITVLDRNFWWEFARTNSGEYEDLPSTIVSTPQKQVGIPDQPPFSCPSLTDHRNVPMRLTVHNFAYCIQSDESGNTSAESNKSNSEEIESRSASPDVTSSHLIYLDATPKMEVKKSVQNKENTNVEKKRNLLSLCHQSDVVKTSFSPREVGVRIEQSFMALFKPTTSKSTYSTPKTLRTDPENTECVDFSTPATSKKIQLHLAKNSSMHLIDLTTPTQLRPMSPVPKSAQKSFSKSILAKLEKTPQKATAKLDASAIIATPLVSNKLNADTPLSTESVVSVDTSTSSVIEVSDVTPDVQMSDKQGVPKTQVPNKSTPNKSVTTPKRMPPSLMKRVLLSSAKKQTKTSASAGLPFNRTIASTGINSPTRRNYTPGTSNKNCTSERQRVSLSCKSKAMPQAEATPLASTSLNTKRATAKLITSTPLGQTKSKLSTTKTSPLRGVRKSVAGTPGISRVTKTRLSSAFQRISPTRSAQLLAKACKTLRGTGSSASTSKQASVSKVTRSAQKPIAKKRATLFANKTMIASESEDLNRTFTLSPDKSAVHEESLVSAESILVDREKSDTNQTINNTFTQNVESETKISLASNTKTLEAEETTLTSNMSTMAAAKLSETYSFENDANIVIEDVHEVVETPIDVAEVNVSPLIADTNNEITLSPKLETLKSAEADEKENLCKTQHITNTTDDKITSTSLRDPKTPNLCGLREMLRSPKRPETNTPRFIGLREMMRTPKSATKGVQEEGDVFEGIAKLLKTPAKDIHEISNTNLPSFTPRRSARRASISAESTLYTPRRVTRRASLTAVASTDQLTPKRITTRRPSLSLDVDDNGAIVSNKTPKCSKSIIIVEETTGDMGAIVEEDSMQSSDINHATVLEEFVDSATDDVQKKQLAEKTIPEGIENDVIDDSICEEIESISEHLGTTVDKIHSEVDAKDDKEESKVLDAVESNENVLDESDYDYGKEVQNAKDTSVHVSTNVISDLFPTGLLTTPKAKVMKSEKSPNTPLMGGVRELLKTPKAITQTPKYVGLRDLMRTPKDTINENLDDNMEGIADMLKTPLTQNKTEILNKTNSAETMSQIEMIVKNDDRIEVDKLKTRKDCRVLLTGGRELLQTPTVSSTPNTSGKKQLLDTSNTIATENVEIKHVEISNISITQNVDTSAEVENLSAEEAFDKLTGQFNTPSVSKVYERKIRTPKMAPSPFSASDVFSDLPKTDIQEWVDSLQTEPEPLNDTELECELSQKATHEQSIELDIKNEDSVPIDPLADSIVETKPITKHSITVETSLNIGETSSAFPEVKTKSSTTAVVLHATDANMSGINLLDETGDSTALSEPLVVSDVESFNDSLQILEQSVEPTCNTPALPVKSLLHEESIETIEIDCNTSIKNTLKLTQTPEMQGVRELLKTPKTVLTPNLAGLRDLMQTPSHNESHAQDNKDITVDLMKPSEVENNSLPDKTVTIPSEIEVTTTKITSSEIVKIDDNSNDATSEKDSNENIKVDQALTFKSQLKELKEMNIGTTKTTTTLPEGDKNITLQKEQEMNLNITDDALKEMHDDVTDASKANQSLEQFESLVVSESESDNSIVDQTIQSEAKVNSILHAKQLSNEETKHVNKEKSYISDFEKAKISIHSFTSTPHSRNSRKIPIDKNSQSLVSNEEDSKLGVDESVAEVTLVEQTKSETSAWETKEQLFDNNTQNSDDTTKDISNTKDLKGLDEGKTVDSLDLCKEVDSAIEINTESGDSAENAAQTSQLDIANDNNDVIKDESVLVTPTEETEQLFLEDVPGVKLTSPTKKKESNEIKSEIVENEAVFKISSNHEISSAQKPKDHQSDIVQSGAIRNESPKENAKTVAEASTQSPKNLETEAESNDQHNEVSLIKEAVESSQSQPEIMNVTTEFEEQPNQSEDSMTSTVPNLEDTQKRENITPASKEQKDTKNVDELDELIVNTSEILPEIDANKRGSSESFEKPSTNLEKVELANESKVCEISETHQISSSDEGSILDNEEKAIDHIDKNNKVLKSVNNEVIITDCDDKEDIVDTEMLETADATLETVVPANKDILIEEQLHKDEDESIICDEAETSVEVGSAKFPTTPSITKIPLNVHNTEEIVKQVTKFEDETSVKNPRNSTDQILKVDTEPIEEELVENMTASKAEISVKCPASPSHCTSSNSQNTEFAEDEIEHHKEELEVESSSTIKADDSPTACNSPNKKHIESEINQNKTELIVENSVKCPVSLDGKLPKNHKANPDSTEKEFAQNITELVESEASVKNPISPLPTLEVSTEYIEEEIVQNTAKFETESSVKSPMATSPILHKHNDQIEFVDKEIMQNITELKVESEASLSPSSTHQNVTVSNESSDEEKFKNILKLESEAYSSSNTISTSPTLQKHRVKTESVEKDVVQNVSELELNEENPTGTSSTLQKFKDCIETTDKERLQNMTELEIQSKVSMSPISSSQSLQKREDNTESIEKHIIESEVESEGSVNSLSPTHHKLEVSIKSITEEKVQNMTDLDVESEASTKSSKSPSLTSQQPNANSGEEEVAEIITESKVESEASVKSQISPSYSPENHKVNTKAIKDKRFQNISELEEESEVSVETPITTSPSLQKPEVNIESIEEERLQAIESATTNQSGMPIDAIKIKVISTVETPLEETKKPTRRLRHKTEDEKQAATEVLADEVVPKGRIGRKGRNKNTKIEETVVATESTFQEEQQQQQAELEEKMQSVESVEAAAEQKIIKRKRENVTKQTTTEVIASNVETLHTPKPASEQSVTTRRNRAMDVQQKQETEVSAVSAGNMRKRRKAEQSETIAHTEDEPSAVLPKRRIRKQAEQIVHLTADSGELSDEEQKKLVTQQATPPKPTRRGGRAAAAKAKVNVEEITSADPAADPAIVLGDDSKPAIHETRTRKRKEVNVEVSIDAPSAPHASTNDESVLSSRRAGGRRVAAKNTTAETDVANVETTQSVVALPAPRKTRKASVQPVEHIVAEDEPINAAAVDNVDIKEMITTTAERKIVRRVPRRVAAHEHNYDESSDTDSAHVPLATIPHTSTPTAEVSSRGRIRKPSKIQLLMEEERQRTATPRGRSVASAALATSETTPTPQRASARRGRKASITESAEIVTPIPTKRGRKQNAATLESLAAETEGEREVSTTASVDSEVPVDNNASKTAKTRSKRKAKVENVEESNSPNKKSPKLEIHDHIQVEEENAKKQPVKKRGGRVLKKNIPVQIESDECPADKVDKSVTKTTIATIATTTRTTRRGGKTVDKQSTEEPQQQQQPSRSEEDEVTEAKKEIVEKTGKTTKRGTVAATNTPTTTATATRTRGRRKRADEDHDEDNLEPTTSKSTRAGRGGTKVVRFEPEDSSSIAATITSSEANIVGASGTSVTETGVNVTEMDTETTTKRVTRARRR